MAKKYNKYEKARLISARALQLSKGVVPLVRTNEINPINQAEEEFKKDRIPFDVCN
ncbi:MAG: DNA-directed RNA polymerase subunit K [Candidatus Nanohalarchaeota archaeon]|nr:MAG: DNA-directed RNA polymerase subunit K [Candidatus Nanohaloarchaeota archaeon]